MPDLPDLVIRRRYSPNHFRLTYWAGWWDGLMVCADWIELPPDRG